MPAISSSNSTSKHWHRFIFTSHINTFISTVLPSFARSAKIKEVENGINGTQRLKQVQNSYLNTLTCIQIKQKVNEIQKNR